LPFSRKSLARGVAFVICQPKDADISEILFRPTQQALRDLSPTEDNSNDPNEGSDNQVE
jgi:hypothetical protein